MITFGGFILTDAGGFWLQPKKRPLPPLPLTGGIRGIWKDGTVPTPKTGSAIPYIPVENDDGLNMWDVFPSTEPDWQETLGFDNNLVEVIQLLVPNITNITRMFSNCEYLRRVSGVDLGESVDTTESMFYGCTRLEYVEPFDLSRIYMMNSMFRECTRLREIPDFVLGTRNYAIYNMFADCYSVETGITRFYDNASSVGIMFHGSTFRNCGINTTTGAAELAQIPASWK